MSSPRDWFIQSERVTSECTVLWRVGYSAWYSRLEQLITKTGNGDEVFLVGWLFQPSVTLGKSTMESVLQDAVGRGARVRALLSAASADPAANASAAATIRKLGGEAILDNQALATPITGTFHQKSVYVRLAHEAHLFVGGMDVALGRVASGTNAWLDVDAEIVGHGAELGRLTLEERWASNTAQAQYAAEVVLGLAPTAFVPGREKNSTFVQFVRTYGKPDQHASARSYAPAGEFKIQELLRHAVDTASKTIYIEDQYFVGDRVNKAKPRSLPSLDEALARAVSRGVELLAVTTRSNQAEAQFTPWTRRKELIHLLTRGLREKSRVRVLQFRSRYNPDVWHNYVHTKAWIFDNDFALIGSANYSRMSMTFEGEFSVGVASVPATDVVPSLRRGLWLALLNAPGTPGGFEEKDVKDWATGRDALIGRRSPLEPYRVDAGSDKFGPNDPDGS
jgi:Phosphatidylserine/phosphatidylglycerophosphate/cardiolipin synthases and related enzymes